MNQALAMYHLQQIDLAILKIQKRQAEINTLLGDSQAVTAAKEAVETATKTLTPLRTKARDLELEIQSTIQKAANAELQLYSGHVTNPKSMQEMQQEIASLKKRQSELEDHLLEQMAQVEYTQSELAAAQTQLEEITVTHTSEHTTLSAELSDLNARLDMLKSQRQTALQPILPENLKLYTSMKTRKSYQPMSLLNEDSCSVCGIEQTMNVIQQVEHGNQLVPCINCGRLLVFRP